MVMILLTGDTHLGFDQPRRGQGGAHRRGEDFFANVERVFRRAVELKVDLLLHGGDLFHRSQEPPAVVDRAFHLLHVLAAEGIPVGIIAGNHERSQLPPSLLMQHSNIHMFHHASSHVFQAGGARVAVTGIPFIREDVARTLPAQAAAVATPDADFKVLLIHQAIEGGVVGPADYTFKAGPDVVSRASLPEGFNAYVSGHIHRRQVLWRTPVDGGKRIPIIHAGSTERTSFAEQHETKGFILLELDGRGGNIHFEPLPARPMVDVVIRQAMELDGVREVLNARLTGEDPRSIVRLQVPEALWPLCSRRLLSPPLLPQMPFMARALRAEAPPSPLMDDDAA